MGLTSPAQLTDLALEQVREKYNMGAIPDMPQLLWQADTRQLMALVPKQALPLTGQTNVELLVDQIRAKNIDGAKIAQGKKSLAKRIGAPADFDQLAHGGETKWMVNSTAPSILLDSFIQKGRELNVMRATQGSIRSVASGIRRYANFCTARDRHWFPPTETTVKEWRATFNHGRAFQMYLRRLQKASFLLDQPINWMTPAVKTVAAGIENAQDKSFQFPNFIQ